MTRRLVMCIVICGLVALWAVPGLVNGQDTGVNAEAIQQANLRAATDVNAALLGQIQAGTRYPVVGRSQFYPWLLLGEPTSRRPIGWVFADLVTVYGNLNSVPFTEQVLSGKTPVPTATLAPVVLSTPIGTVELVGVALPTASPTPQSGVVGRVTGEINIRYGPGLEYPRIGVAQAGTSFEITGYHTQLPWVQIRYADAPNGFGWVAIDLLEIEGNIYDTSPISQLTFNLPTLTPTAPVVVASTRQDETPVPLSPAFEALGNALWSMVLDAGFDPETSRLAALYVRNLQTGEAITFGNEFAFSGTSINKIAILTDLYSRLDSPPNNDLAVDIANMMVCSENSASNALLEYIGNGDSYQGALEVTRFLQEIGMGNTYIVAPFLLDPNATPVPVRAPTTQADQIRAEPDYSNQLTVDDMGWLLNGIYQCAVNGNGSLMSAAPEAFDQRECRHMLDVMSSNNLGEPLLMSAGVPENTRVAHKHGWTADTHGNAGIVFTPGGDYVLVVALHNPVWLDFSESFPLITSISQTVYNYFNPTAPVETPRAPYIVEVQDCDVLGSPIVGELLSYE